MSDRLIAKQELASAEVRAREGYGYVMRERLSRAPRVDPVVFELYDARDYTALARILLTAYEAAATNLQAKHGRMRADRGAVLMPIWAMHAVHECLPGNLGKVGVPAVAATWESPLGEPPGEFPTECVYVTVLPDPVYGLNLAEGFYVVDARLPFTWKLGR